MIIHMMLVSVSAILIYYVGYKYLENDDQFYAIISI